jgi:hypothetical protein
MQKKHASGADDQLAPAGTDSSGLSRRSFLAVSTVAAATVVLPQSALTETSFRRIPTQFIAALGDPTASSGSNAHLWGLWRLDPGPRGVWLDGYEQLKAANGVAPARWQFDSADWWLEEHGLIMEAPEFPLAAGRYRVTGNRWLTTTLIVDPMGKDGNQDWSLADGATLYDVTHLACRSARYSPAAGDTACSPAEAEMADFPVAPGAAMPPVEDCNKQDYAVLLVTGVEA